MATDKTRRKRVVPRWLVVFGVIFIVGFTGVLLFRALFPQQYNRLLGGVSGTQTPAAAVQFAEVITLTSVTSVEASGVVEPLQQATVFWETTGQVAGVHVAIGDIVEADQILMSLDPETVPQSIVQAQVDLINAQNTLEDLANPTALEIANAQQAVALAREALDAAQNDYSAARNPAGEALYDAVADAELALFQARSNEQLTNVSADQQALPAAQAETAQTLRRLQELQAIWDDDVGNQTDELQQQIESAQAAYEAALDSQHLLEYRIDLDQVTQQDTVAKAEESLEDAVADLNSALLGPDALDVETTAAALLVAQAELVDAETTLDDLLAGPDPDDVLAAQATILAAENTLDTMFVRAPFAGEVLDLGYRKGDLVDQSQYAATIATTGRLFVTIQVDEVDIATFKVGQPATLEFIALPGVSLRAVVSQVSRQGVEVDGVVRYDVDLTLLASHPDLRLGMTADAEVVTEVKEGALAIPLDALQFDGQSEFVMAVDPPAEAPRRADIITGDIVGEYTLVVAGELTPGQRLLLPAQTEAGQQGGGFGPPGRGFRGGGGD